MRPPSLAHLVGKLTVKLHYRQKLDIYSLCSLHEPELYAKSQRKAKIPASVRWAVWRRDHFKCHYCGIWGNNLSLDHIVPETYGGQGVPENLVTACAKCNAKKGSMGYTDFLKSPWLAKKKAASSAFSKAERVPPPNLPKE